MTSALSTALAVAETNARRAGDEFFRLLRREAPAVEVDRARMHLPACLDDARLAAEGRDEARALNRPVLQLLAGGRT